MRIEEIDFGKLRAFQLVAQGSSLKGAAAQLHLTVSAVSAKIARLEQIMGISLFHRHAKALVLTESGRQLLAEITPIIEQTALALSSVTSHSTEVGRISIAVGGDYAWYFIPKLNRFWSLFPNFELNMRVYRASDALMALQNGQIDLCMGVYPRVPRGILVGIAAQSPFSLIYKPSGRSRERVQDIVRDRLIVAPRGTSTRDLVRKSEGLLKATKTTYIECPTCHTAIDLVNLDAGPAIVHTLCIADRLPPELRKIDLGSKFGNVPFVILRPRKVQMSDALSFIIREATR